MRYFLNFPLAIMIDIEIFCLCSSRFRVSFPSFFSSCTQLAVRVSIVSTFCSHFLQIKCVTVLQLFMSDSSPSSRCSEQRLALLILFFSMRRYTSTLQQREQGLYPPAVKNTQQFIVICPRAPMTSLSLTSMSPPKIYLRHSLTTAYPAEVYDSALTLSLSPLMIYSLARIQYPGLTQQLRLVEMALRISARECGAPFRQTMWGGGRGLEREMGRGGGWRSSRGSLWGLGLVITCIEYNYQGRR